METTRTLQGIELDFDEGYVFGGYIRPISEGLINCASVCDVTFETVEFNDENTAKILGILQNKRNLRSLSLKNVYFGVDNGKADDVLESISTALTRPGSLLRSFEYDCNLEHVADGSILTLFRAIAKSPLKRFKFGIISQQQMQAFADNVPSMRVQELEVSVSRFIDQQIVKKALFRAIGKNFSVRSVKCSRDARSLFSRDEDQRRLTFYINRNERLDEWVENKTTLDEKLWPEALRLAARAGKDTLFRSLKSVLGSDYVKQRAARKRKQTKFYSPGRSRARKS